MRPRLNTGEVYVGVLLANHPGERDQHIVVTSIGDKCVDWQTAHATNGQHSNLPSMRELMLLHANQLILFKKMIYWSSEEHSHYEGFVHFHSFRSGCNGIIDKKETCGVIAVRREDVC